MSARRKWKKVFPRPRNKEENANDEEKAKGAEPPLTWSASKEIAPGSMRAEKLYRPLSASDKQSRKLSEIDNRAAARVYAR